ncbi:hypothetical protein pb186bvf_018985 [Paramecium bursaria]
MNQLQIKSNQRKVNPNYESYHRFKINQIRKQKQKQQEKKSKAINGKLSWIHKWTNQE